MPTPAAIFPVGVHFPVYREFQSPQSPTQNTGSAGATQGSFDFKFE